MNSYIIMMKELDKNENSEIMKQVPMIIYRQLVK
jgi:hypothetical protein